MIKLQETVSSNTTTNTDITILSQNKITTNLLETINILFVKDT